VHGYHERTTADVPVDGRRHGGGRTAAGQAFTALWKRQRASAGVRTLPMQLSILSWSESCIAAHGPLDSSDRCTRPLPASRTITWPAQCP
jgi:hypothetical protein